MRLRKGANVMPRKSAPPQELLQGIKEYQTALYRLAYSYVKNKENALDIVQESILKALTSHHTLRSKFIKAWLFRIVVNTSISFLRKQKPLTYTETPPDQSDCAAPKWEEKLDLMDALDRLEMTSRTVLILHYFEDLTLKEIALATETNPNTVKSRLYAAQNKLRELLSVEVSV